MFLFPYDHIKATTYVIRWRNVAAKNVHPLLAQKVSKEIGVKKHSQSLAGDLSYVTCKNWCSPNISLRVFGANAFVSLIWIFLLPAFIQIMPRLCLMNLNVSDFSLLIKTSLPITGFVYKFNLGLWLLYVLIIRLLLLSRLHIYFLMKTCLRLLWTRSIMHC